MNDFDKKIMEARVKQSNRKWLAKEIIIGIVAAFIVYVLIASK